MNTISSFDTFTLRSLLSSSPSTPPSGPTHTHIADLSATNNNNNNNPNDPPDDNTKQQQDQQREELTLKLSQRIREHGWIHLRLSSDSERSIVREAFQNASQFFKENSSMEKW